MNKPVSRNIRVPISKSLSELDMKILNLKNEIFAAKTKNEALLEAKTKNLKEFQRGLENGIQRKTSERNKLQSQLSKNKVDATTIERNITQLQSEISGLAARLESEKKIVNTERKKGESIKKLMNTLAATVPDRQTKLSQMNDTIKQLEGKLKESKDKEAKAVQNIESLKKGLNSRQTKLSGLQQQLVAKNARISELQSNLNANKNTIEQTNTKITNLEAQLSDLRQTKTTLETALPGKQEIINAEVAQRGNLNAQISNLNSSNKTQRIENRQKVLNSALSAVRKEIINTNNELKKVKEERGTLNSGLKTNNSALSNLKGKYTTQMKTLENKSSALQKLKNELNNDKKSLGELQARKITPEKIKELEDSIQKISGEIKANTEQVQNITRQLTSGVEINTTNTKSIEDELALLQKDFDEEKVKMKRIKQYYRNKNK